MQVLNSSSWKLLIPLHRSPLLPLCHCYQMVLTMRTLDPSDHKSPSSLQRLQHAHLRQKLQLLLRMPTSHHLLCTCLLSSTSLQLQLHLPQPLCAREDGEHLSLCLLRLPDDLLVHGRDLPLPHRLP